MEAADNDEYRIQSGMFMHAADQIQPVQNGHADIGNDQVRLKLFHHVERFGAVIRFSHNAEFERFPLD
ncbi:hypothetical protein D3C76_1810860 [compost metagenome]